MYPFDERVVGSDGIFDRFAGRTGGLGELLRVGCKALRQLPVTLSQFVGSLPSLLGTSLGAKPFRLPIIRDALQGDSSQFKSRAGAGMNLSALPNSRPLHTRVCCNEPGQKETRRSSAGRLRSFATALLSTSTVSRRDCWARCAARSTS